MKRLIFILTAIFVFVAGSAFAITYTIDDTWTDWPGYTSAYAGQDIIGEPSVGSLSVEIDSSKMLQSITVNFLTNVRITFDSLFINTDYDGSNSEQWDFYVLDGYDASQAWVVADGSLPTQGDGLYSVSENYSYTTVANTGRAGNPNGIDYNGLSSWVDFSPSYDSTNYKLIYDFSEMGIDASNGLFIAYAPWCANDVIGGSPVPEPATLLLLGSGILGLGLYRRFKK